MTATLGVATAAVAGPAAEAGAAPPTKLEFVTGTPHQDTALSSPSDVLPTADGGFLFTEPRRHRVRKASADGTITNAAGNPEGHAGTGGFAGDGGEATAATLNTPSGLTLLADGSYAFTDTLNRRVRRVAPNGIITTIVGTGDDPPAAGGTTAGTVDLGTPGALETLPDGDLLISDGEYDTIWRVDSGLDTSIDPADTVIDTGIDRGWLASDGTGGFFVADFGDRRVRYVAAGGAVTKVAGDDAGTQAPDAEFNGEDAKSVGIGQPSGIAATPDGGFQFWAWEEGTDWGGQLLQVGSDGKIRTLLRSVGTGCCPGRTIMGGLARAPGGLLLPDGLWGVVWLLHKTFLQSGPPADPGPPHGSNASPTFTFSSPDHGATFQCQVDTGPVLPCTSPYQVPAVPDGDHTFRVQATDAGGSQDPTPETSSWTSDATGPQFALSSPADGATTGPRPTLSWQPATDATGVASYEVLVDGTKVADVAASGCGASCSFTTATLADGPHRWQVVAIDTPGNRRASEERGFNVAAAPRASFTVNPSRALTGTTVTFDGSASSVENGQIAAYEWDLDGDGSFETNTGTSPTASRSYGTVQNLRPALLVRAAGGLTDRTDRSLEIRLAPPPGPVGASIDDGARFTGDPRVDVTLRWPAFTLNATVSNDGGFSGAQVFPVAPAIQWTLDSSGPERLPKTIYVRFDDSTVTFQDDIILDETSPVLSSATLSRRARTGAKPVAASVKSSGYLLTVRAADAVSGVAEMQLARDRKKLPGWRRYRTRTGLKSSRAVWVRVRDRAGNKSGWRLAKLR